jgi:hypothetical protein
MTIWCAEKRLTAADAGTLAGITRVIRLKLIMMLLSSVLAWSCGKTPALVCIQGMAGTRR